MHRAPNLLRAVLVSPVYAPGQYGWRGALGGRMLLVQDGPLGLGHGGEYRGGRGGRRAADGGGQGLGRAQQGVVGGEGPPVGQVHLDQLLQLAVDLLHLVIKIIGLI